MSTTSQPWTDSQFAPDSDSDPEQELRPYRVTIGEETYDQSDFTANTGHRYHGFVGGVGSGKTLGGIIRMAANVQAWNPGSMGAIVTPTSLGIKNAILPKLERWGFFEAGWEYHGPQSEQPGLHTPNGTRVLLESASNERKIERLRGYDLAWFWLDEARNVPERAWDVLTGRLRIGDYRNAWITTTPAGRANWVYKRFHPESGRQLDDVNAVLGVPSYANPHLPLDYRRDILDDYEGQFYAQEVEGAFVEMSGLVYPWFEADEHIVDGLEDVPGRIEQIVYGVDWGFHPHPAAILAIAITSGGYAVVLGEHYETRNTVEDLTEIAQGMVDRIGPGPFYCDPSEPSNIETFQRAGLNAQKADNSVEPGIQHVHSRADDLRVLPACQALINEFGQYAWQDGGEEPIDKHDHAMDALRYGLFTHEQEGSLNIGVGW